MKRKRDDSLITIPTIPKIVIERVLPSIRDISLLRDSLPLIVFDKEKTTIRLTNVPERKVYRCSYCPVFFENEIDLYPHIRLNHLNIFVPSKCNQCDKYFKSDNQLKDHVLFSHSDERKYVCTVKDCGRRYKHKCSLKRHTDKYHQ